jgi:hypothetical protein
VESNLGVDSDGPVSGHINRPAQDSTATTRVLVGAKSVRRVISDVGFRRSRNRKRLEQGSAAHLGCFADYGDVYGGGFNNPLMTDS